MNFNLGSLLSLFRWGQSAPTQAEINQAVAQGGGAEMARDTMVRHERRQRALAMLGRRPALKRVEQQLGIGRVAAGGGAKKG